MLKSKPKIELESKPKLEYMLKSKPKLEYMLVYALEAVIVRAEQFIKGYKGLYSPYSQISDESHTVEGRIPVTESKKC